MNSAIPINYRLKLEPELEKFRFFGKVEITMQSVSSISEIILNVLELAIWKCQVFAGDELKDCAFCVEPEKESLKIILPQAVEGLIRLNIEYDGIINNKMAASFS